MGEQFRPHEGRQFAKEELVEWPREHDPGKVSSLFQRADDLGKIYMEDKAHNPIKMIGIKKYLDINNRDQ